MKTRLILLIRSICGLIIKSLIDLFFVFKISPGKLDDSSDVIISLTSYGRRVPKAVPYTIYSIFLQKKKPSKIILWLDDINWNEDNLPAKLRFLKQHGLEIRFCKDIRSYKKLIYTLPLYPSKSIITIDDDILYERSFVKELVRLHEQHPCQVISLRYHKPKWDKEGYSLLPYKVWSKAKEAKATKNYMPTGVGGVLYPPGSFNDEVMNEQVFTKLCPLADDVWFWAMEILNDTKVFCVKKMMYYPFDFFYQEFHRGASLYDSNVTYSENDNQIKAVLDYYNLWNKM